VYVRIARFEGGEGNWDERIDEIRGRMAAGRQEDVPVKRALMLADREAGRGASIMFCETEDDLRRIDEYMNAQSPPPGGGTRTSVERYEVAVDSDEL
jgi:hypothetical protein